MVTPILACVGLTEDARLLASHASFRSTVAVTIYPADADRGLDSGGSNLGARRQLSVRFPPGRFRRNNLGTLRWKDAIRPKMRER